MKKLVALLLLTHSLYAQMGVLSPLGIEFPRFSAAARPAPNTVGIGTMLFNSTNGTHQYSDGSAWRNLSALPPAGTNQQTLRYDGSNWVGSDLMRNNGTRVRIGEPFYVSGEDDFTLNVVATNLAFKAHSTNSTAIRTVSEKGTAIYATTLSGKYALVAEGSVGNYSAGLEGRIKMSPLGIEPGIEFSAVSLFDPSNAFIGMRGMTELAVYGYGYGNYIQRWNINTGSICYATTPTVCSDIRLKKDFRQLAHSSEKINQLQGYQYYWKNEKSPDLQTGLIAQEVQKIFPELVRTDDEGMLSVDYVGLIPHLIEANKSLSARIEKLEAALLKQH